MDLSFANPAGLWALLGLPAVLAIHFLQREAPRRVVSTLFLVEMLAPVSAQGRRIDRLRNSVPLWLQLAAILLLTWVLVQPRWLRPDSVQGVTVVLDGSVSMEAFREKLRAALRSRLGELSRAARHTEWRLVESDPARPPLYAGGDLEALTAALDRWSPRLGDHDPRPALAVARGLRGGKEIVIFATDHSAALPEGTDQISVGEPIPNVGFSGLRADAGEWSTLVINFGAEPQSRTWWIETPAGKSPPQRIDLKPGEVRTLHGKYSADRFEVALSGDRFAIDDRLPIVRPRPKILSLSAPAGHPFFERLAKSVPDTVLSPGPANLTFGVYDPLAPAPIPPRAIVEVRDPRPAERYVSGPIIAENHPLTKNLSWEGFLCRDTLEIPPQPGDEVLVWAGRRPLVFLRGRPGEQSLVLNFQVAQSNADRMPAFVVLLNRFIASVREGVVAKESLNVETNQTLAVAAAQNRGPLEIDHAPPPPGPLRAPDRPRLFAVTQENNLLLDGAAHFADSREADFRTAAPADSLAGRAGRLIEQRSERDFLTPWFILALAGVCLANWAAVAPPSGRKKESLIAPPP